MSELAEMAVITEINREVERRRTFAIISHPDAGKTTLTEKLLLYSGAIELAGAVKARKNQRHATSDCVSKRIGSGLYFAIKNSVDLFLNCYRFLFASQPR